MTVVGIGLIGEVLALQRAVNEEREAMTPAERAASAREQLRYIGEVEESAPDWYRDA